MRIELSLVQHKYRDDYFGLYHYNIIENVTTVSNLNILS